MSPPQTTSPKKPRKELPLRSKLGWIIVALTVLIVWGFAEYLRTGEVGILESTRVWLITIALWLAWPELSRLPRSLFLTIPVDAVVCAWRPQLLFVVLPATLFYFWLLPPRSRRQKNDKTNAKK